MLGAPVSIGTFMDLQKTTLSELIDILFIQRRFFNSNFIVNELAINKINSYNKFNHLICVYIVYNYLML